MAVAGGVKGVELTVGVAVWVPSASGSPSSVEVGVGVCAEGVGVGVNACSAGVCVASGVAVEVAAGSCAMAMPPSTAAYRPAQHRAMAKIFFGDRLTRLNSHARGPLPGGSDSAQLRHRVARA